MLAMLHFYLCTCWQFCCGSYEPLEEDESFEIGTNNASPVGGLEGRMAFSVMWSWQPNL